MPRSSEVKIPLRYKLEVLLGTRVNMHECPCNGDRKPDMFHGWDCRRVASGIYESGAVSREGWVCTKCMAVEWVEHDEEFMRSLCNSAPHVIIQATFIAENYIQYIPAKLWERRVEYQNEVKIQKIRRERLLNEVRSGNMEGSVEAPCS